jgi:hypothetical protein
MLQWLRKAFRERTLEIDPKRINDEERREKRVELYADVEYRKKVMKRMMKGLTAAQMPPLIDRDQVLREARWRQRRNARIQPFLRRA